MHKPFNYGPVGPIFVDGCCCLLALVLMPIIARMSPCRLRTARVPWGTLEALPEQQVSAVNGLGSHGPKSWVPAPKFAARLGFSGGIFYDSIAERPPPCQISRQHYLCRGPERLDDGPPFVLLRKVAIHQSARQLVGFRS